MTLGKIAQSDANVLNRMLVPSRVQLNVIGTNQFGGYREAQRLAAWMPYHNFEIARGISASRHINLSMKPSLSASFVRRTMPDLRSSRLARSSDSRHPSSL